MNWDGFDERVVGMTFRVRFINGTREARVTRINRLGNICYVEWNAAAKEWTKEKSCDGLNLPNIGAVSFPVHGR
jgi:hypothetical protein